METFSSIECFVRSAEVGSFAEAARRLSLTPAAVGKNVARLEARMGVRLFLRSTRRLTLTEAGQRFLEEVSGSFAVIQNAVANLASVQGQPAGTLRVSMGTVFGRLYVVPLLGEFLRRYPDISPDWHFDNRQVDLPADLAAQHGILIRSPQTGRVRAWPLTGPGQAHAELRLPARITLSDSDAACAAALQGLGVALVSMPFAVPYLAQGSLVRVLPEWYVDDGNIWLYYAEHKLLPGKTRVFIDYLIEQFAAQGLARRFTA